MSKKKKGRRPRPSSQTGPAPQEHREPLTLSQDPPEALAYRVFLYEIAVITVIAALVFLARRFPGSPLILPLALAGCGMFFVAARFVFPNEPARAFELFLANGFAALVILRPWVDGITYPQYNVYFFWGAAALLIVWVARSAWQGERLSCAVAIGLLLAFWIAAFLTGLKTVQVHATYRSLITWAGFLFLFIVATNGLRTRFAVGLVLGAFVLTTPAQSLYAILHLWYLLPSIRAMVQDHPEMFGVQLGGAEISAEFLHRLHVNRAFGSFLFPNALAAFLLLGIPVALGGLASQARSFRREPTRPTREQCRQGVFHLLTNGFSTPASASIHFGLAAGAASFSAYYVFYRYIAYPGLSWTAHPTRWALWVVVAPLLIGALAYAMQERCGLRSFWWLVRLVTLAAACLFAVIALFLTFSRGGLVGLAGGVLAGTTLLLWANMRRRSPTRRAGPSLAALLVLVCVASFLGSASSKSSEDARGVWRSLDELLNPQSFGLRMGYWRAGLRMTEDNLLTGVGLGNFGTAYPKYQRLGESDVKHAHNDYLQAFCETGIVGGLLFCAFWFYVLWCGARRILAEQDAGRRWVLAGLFAGITAFLLHSLVDFNFFNPSLATFAFSLAGLLFSPGWCVESPAPVQEPLDVPTTKNTPSSTHGGPRRVGGWAVRAFAVSLALLALGLSWAGVGIWRVDRAIGNWAAVNARMSAAEFFLSACSPNPSEPSDPARRRLPETDYGASAPQFLYAAVLALIPSKATLEGFGQIIVPDEKGESAGRLRQGKQPFAGPEVFIVNDRPTAYRTAKTFIKHWIDFEESADRRHPHSPELAAQVFRWYDLLREYEMEPKERLRLAQACVKSAGRAAARSPQQALYQSLYGHALWEHADLEQGAGRVALYEQALEQFRLAAELYPTSRELWMNYANRLASLGQALKTQIDPERGEAYMRTAEEARRYAQTLPPREEL